MKISYIKTPKSAQTLYNRLLLFFSLLLITQEGNAWSLFQPAILVPSFLRTRSNMNEFRICQEGWESFITLDFNKFCAPQSLKDCMKAEKVKGFLKVIVASTATEGVSFL